jgi:hypothetical protein
MERDLRKESMITGEQIYMGQKTISRKNGENKIYSVLRDVNADTSLTFVLANA